MRCLLTPHDTQESGPVPPQGPSLRRKSRSPQLFCKRLTIQHIFDTGEAPVLDEDVDTVSARLAASYRKLQAKLTECLRQDAFRLLGIWADFITNRLYFAVFVHPDASSAYQVFEVINTRGRELTTADLLKNYVLSQTPQRHKEDTYRRWQQISGNFAPEGSSNTFVQYIRHVVTVHSGHILPKDLFGFLAERNDHPGRAPPNCGQLLVLLEENLPAYLQMIDPSLSGPVRREELQFYAAFNSLGVITVRPILLALTGTARPREGLDFLLRLVVRRMVVGNLGTGNVERRLSEAAHRAACKTLIDSERRKNTQASNDVRARQLVRF